MDGNGEGLGEVAAGSAADGQDEVRFVAAGDGNAFPQLFDCRIGHDSGDFRHILAGVLQALDHPVIDAVFFDGAAPIDQDDLPAVFFKFRTDLLEGSLPEKQFCGIAVCEIS